VDETSSERPLESDEARIENVLCSNINSDELVVLTPQQSDSRCSRVNTGRRTPGAETGSGRAADDKDQGSPEIASQPSNNTSADGCTLNTIVTPFKLHASC